MTVPVPTDRLVALLERAWKRIEDPARFTTRGHYAELANGEGTSAYDPNACRWCMLGTVRREAMETQEMGLISHAYDVLAEAKRELGYEGPLPLVNDDMGHAVVREIFAVATEKARGWG